MANRGATNIQLPGTVDSTAFRRLIVAQRAIVDRQRPSAGIEYSAASSSVVVTDRALGNRHACAAGVLNAAANIRHVAPRNRECR